MPDASSVLTPARLQRWAVEVFLPFWVIRGFNLSRGCFHEVLDRSGDPVAGPATRSRVQARQAYTMAAGARLTGDPIYRLRAEAALDFLLTKMRRSDGLVAVSTSPAGTLVDASASLYDQAFALFALGHGISTCPHRAAEYEAAADSLWGCIVDLLTHPAGGFREQAESQGPRLQNPHMHLLEAMLSLLKTTGKAKWRDQAEALVALFDRAFFDPETGSVIEYLTDDLSKPDPAKGQIREPGHGCEWAWLLDQAGQAGIGPAPHPAISVLWATAVRQGEMAPETGLRLTLDLAYPPMHPNHWIDPVRRVWPQTEAIKAALAVARTSNTGTSQREVNDRLALLFTHWLDLDSALWTERRTPEGLPTDALCPASTPYHIMVAVEELLNSVEAVPS